jgi:hypothetical protein
MFAASKTDGSAVAPDAQFNYVTMLLHGDGTNGAQNNTFLDSSTNNFSITRNGNTTQGSFSPYGSNWSNYFPNSGSVQYSGVSTALQFTGDFTIEGWYNLANFNNAPAGGNPTLIGNGTANWLLVITGGEYNFYASGSLILTSSSASTSANVWNHFALVRSGSTLEIYHNGVSVGSTTNSATLSIGSNVTVGSNGTGGIGSILGYISNVRVVKGTAVYTANFTPPTTPLTAISGTQLLAAQANRFIDSSSNNFSATIEAGPSVQRFNPFGTSTAYSTSVIGGSGYFDGSGDYLGCGTQTAYAMGTGDFTMEAWINFPSASSYRHIFSTRPNSGSSSANGSLTVNSSNGITWYTSGFIIDYTTNIGTNQWIHVAISRSGTTLRVFINGAIVGTATNSDNLTGSTLTIGANGDGSETFNGYISNARVVKGTAVYTSAFTPPTAPLTAITNTSLLLNMTNGAIFDNAMINDLETVGNAQISTSVKKYGTGSIAFDGSGDTLIASANPIFALGSGQYTVEFWMYWNSVSNINEFICFTTTGNTGCFTLYYSGGTLQAVATGGAGGTSGSWSPSTNTWYHVAVTRDSSNNQRIFIDGTQIATATSTNNYDQNGFTLCYAKTFNGYIDDLRITKGYARYTANFTPPTAAFPNIGPV